MWIYMCYRYYSRFTFSHINLGNLEIVKTIDDLSYDFYKSLSPEPRVVTIALTLSVPWGLDQPPGLVRHPWYLWGLRRTPEGDFSVEMQF